MEQASSVKKTVRVIEWNCQSKKANASFDHAKVITVAYPDVLCLS
jgi:hypothetical protein